MDTENFALHNCSDSKVVEYLNTVLPWVCISILADAFVVESIDSGDLSSLVITSQEGDTIWPFKFKAHQHFKCLNRIVATIDKIAHKYVVRVWHLSSLLK